MARKPQAPFPTREQIATFIRESPVPVGKREVARAFNITGNDRMLLKKVLRELESDGTVDRGRKRKVAKPGSLPEIAVVEVTEIDSDGEPVGVPAVWKEPGKPPRILLAPDRPGSPSVTTGERVLAKLRRVGPNLYEGRVIRKLGGPVNRVLGVYDLSGDGGVLRPTDRKHRQEYRIEKHDAGGAKPGDLVLAEILRAPRLGLHSARVIELLGSTGNPRSISLIAIYTNDIPTEFPAAALEQAEKAKPVALGKRKDLRGIPLVTIDGADARDFDDAVFAEPDPDPNNPGGWHLMVAIADVAHYVRPGDALDKSAHERGNSVYFPDRVVPMLPEALSNDLCSLRPHEDRACMAVHMWVDARGRKLKHNFVRGLMRSAARLTYEQAQAAIDGRPDDTSGPLVETVLKPLFSAYKALDESRRARGTLELDLAERQVVLGEDGRVAAIRLRDRFDSHKLIEEFMILANVCAAETIESLRLPCMYRVHDEPDPEKLEGLREVLHGIELNMAKGQKMTPKQFNGILRQVRGGPNEQMVNQLVLRSQAQAVYSPDNLGHFGLALQRYAHFTSPIRRYSDLLVHRALIRGLKLGLGALSDEEMLRFNEIGEHISVTERRAAHAERDAIDRFVTAFMADRVGASFEGRINGVTRFGLFVTLDETGADGLIPIRTLPADYYDHDEAHHRLVGRARGLTLTMGDRVEIRLAEADQVTGGLLFELLSGGTQGAPGGPLTGKKSFRKIQRSGKPPAARGKGGRQGGKKAPKRGR